MARRYGLKQSAIWPGESRFARMHLRSSPSLSEVLSRTAGAPDIRIEDQPLPLWQLLPSSPEVQVNAALAEMTGQPSHVEASCHWKGLLHPADRRSAWRTFIAARATGQGFRLQVRVRHALDGFRWAKVQAAPRAAADTSQSGWLGSCIDIHDDIQDQQRLHQELELRTKMLDGSVDCIKFIDLDGRVLRMNRAGCLALGVPEDEVNFGMKWLDLLPPEIRAAGRKAIQQARQGEAARFAGKSIAATGTIQHWDNMLTPVRGEDGQVRSILCISREVTRQRAAEQSLRIASEIDHLTGLCNRRAFEASIRRMIRRARQQRGSFGLLLLDLDHFKHINDTLGHSAGDHLLRTLARRLNTWLQSPLITIYRLGGDEFAILADDIEQPQRLLDIAAQAVRQLDAPVTFDGHFINGGMSIGAAIYPQDGDSLSRLMASADTALNDLKAGGRGGVRLFAPAMLRQAELAAEQFGLARMIIRQHLAEPHYQPKVDLANGRMIGMEALLRWRDADGELQLPAKVSEAFNDYDLANGIGEMMQTKVFADMARWRTFDLPLVPVSINVTPVEFLRGDFARRLLARMRHFDIPPPWIEIEVTEQMLSSRHAEFIARDLRLLKAQGVIITLDDFGTGHSSFTHLRDYPIDALKIDSGFVRRIDVDPSSLAVVKAVIALGALFQVKVIAEGVETEVQRQLLQEAGCRWGQGFLYARAVDAETIQRMLPAMTTELTD